MKSIQPFIFLILPIIIYGCNKEPNEPQATNLTIFFVNDQHGQLENYAKIKHIIDQELEKTNVVVASGGDLFSGNPVVDNYEDKGYPMIDIMNKVGFQVSVLGNHEFDYGTSTLQDRIEQSDFDWICANVEMANSGVTQPDAFKTLIINDLKVTFLGLIETNGSSNEVIPSTHPLKVSDISFQRPEGVVSQYQDLKEQEEADLYIALTHLGHNGRDGSLGDFQLAQQFPYFDMIIGGHSHAVIDTVINGIPIFQAGSYLDYLGKVELVIKGEGIESYHYELIPLDTYSESDPAIVADISSYNEEVSEVMDEVIGYSEQFHERNQVGCFYVDALRNRLDVDLTFQNTGGVRASLDEGEITVGEIYAIDPFNNGTIIYSMSAAEIKDFLAGTQTWHYYSGIQITQAVNDIELRDDEGNLISNETMLEVGINDYIPAVNSEYFPEDGVLQSFTTAEALIYYLRNMNGTVDYTSCSRVFKYQ